MHAFFLLLPLLLIRYGLLYVCDRQALKRAAHFPPAVGGERVALWIYQLSTVLIVVSLCFLRVWMDSRWLMAGLFVYGAGTLLFAVATVHFASPSPGGLNQRGVYRLSRNPMYVAYFVYFLGCVLLTQSFVLLLLVLVFQASAHRLVLCEERWCREAFGADYEAYAKRVPRYV